MIQMVIDNAHKEGIWAGICGELGADNIILMVIALYRWGLMNYSD
ncbi:MAG: putative PEP-binding protein [Blautia wexlerae]